VIVVNTDVVRKGAAIHCVFEMLVSFVLPTFMFDDNTVPANDGAAAPVRAKTARVAINHDRTWRAM
jgi:hypothetical protein